MHPFRYDTYTVCKKSTVFLTTLLLAASRARIGRLDVASTEHIAEPINTARRASRATAAALPLADRATSYTRRQAALSTRHRLFSGTGKWRARERDLGRVGFVDKHVASVVAVRQLQLVVGDCHLDCVVSVQHDVDHDGGRLAAIGRGEDECRRVLTGEVRQLQTSAERRRSTARHQRTTSTTQPQNCESACQRHTLTLRARISGFFKPFMSCERFFFH